MGTIADKLLYTMAAKGLIKSAIVDKGVAVPDDTPLGEYGDLIEQIGGGDASDAEDIQWRHE